MTRLLRIDKYTDENKKPTIPRNAKYCYSTIFDGDDVDQETLYSPDGWNIDTEKTSLLYYDGDEIPSIKYEAEEEFKEDDHPRDNDGKFTDKGDTREKISNFKNKLRERVKPNKRMNELQSEVEEEVITKLEQEIQTLGIQDKVHSIEMQGSVAKGTDLPTSGSDLDIFVVFNTDVPEEEREKYGTQIGMKALDGKDPYLQTATTKYAEAYFKYEGEEMEVQVVPTRHLTLEQIKNKELDGNPISIGMERTPHQTAFMKEALKGKEGEVRMLKQFMKDTRLYDSSMKSQGFSGYSAEVLIHNFDTFENVLKFFADFKVGSVVGEGDGNEQNSFSLMDPIDPNRDLISAFSPVKIGRTVKVAQHFLEHGEPPKQSEPVEMNSASVSWDTSELNEDTLVGQVRRTQKSITKQLKRLGFDIPIKEEKITDEFTVDVPRTSMDHEKGSTKAKMTFGSKDLTIPETYKDKGVPLTIPKAVDAYRKANQGLEFVEEDGRVKAIKKRKFTHLVDALKYLITSPTSDVQQTNVIEDMRNGIQTSVGTSKFENLI